MSATAEKIDIDALERDTRGRLEQLRDQRQRLALDALGNATARRGLAKVELELGEQEHELQRIELAKVERERREVESAQAEVDEFQRAAYEDAQLLQAHRERAAKSIDRATVALAKATREYVETCRAQQEKLKRAGRPQIADIAKPLGSAVEASFALALRDLNWAGGLRGFDRWQQLTLQTQAHQRPLVEGDARPVEPLAPTRQKGTT